jgi:uncharacterized protein YceK
MRQIVTFCLVLVLGLALSGCYTTMVTAPGIRYPVTMSAVRATTVKFERSSTVWYALFGLVPFGQPDVNKILNEEIQKNGGKGIANFQVETGMKVPMVFLNIITGYVTVYNQQVIIRGEVYK